MLVLLSFKYENKQFLKYAFFYFYSHLNESGYPYKLDTKQQKILSLQTRLISRHRYKLNLQTKLTN